MILEYLGMHGRGGCPMASVFDVAKYILSKSRPEEGDGMTHLKLQKLVYYVQGFATVILNRALFDEDMEAWTHGPVVPALYAKYRGYSNGIIENYDGIIGDADNLTSEEKELVDDVFNVYGQYSASKLRSLTHNETPWLEAMNKIDTTITVDALREFFPSLLN